MISWIVRIANSIRKRVQIPLETNFQDNLFVIYFDLFMTKKTSNSLLNQNPLPPDLYKQVSTGQAKKLSNLQYWIEDW